MVEETPPWSHISCTQNSQNCFQSAIVSLLCLSSMHLERTHYRWLPGGIGATDCSELAVTENDCWVTVDCQCPLLKTNCKNSCSEQQRIQSFSKFCSHILFLKLCQLMVHYISPDQEQLCPLCPYLWAPAACPAFLLVTFRTVRA